jgi:hypothetical protein
MFEHTKLKSKTNSRDESPKTYRVVLLFGLIAGICAFSLMPLKAQERDEPVMPTNVRLLIAEVREAIAPFRDVQAAEEAGYGDFLTCLRHGEEMGMGQHYVNGDFVGDDHLDPLQPEALVYEPQEDGSLILVAMEYLVFEDQWEGDEPPILFEQEFALKTNIPETPPVWALHIWLFAHNPEGLFADYNPLVFCQDGETSIDMSMQ